MVLTQLAVINQQGRNGGSFHTTMVLTQQVTEKKPKSFVSASFHTTMVLTQRCPQSSVHFAVDSFHTTMVLTQLL